MYIQLKNTNFSYESKDIINNLSMNIEKASILAIIGVNGIGKTTLLKCLTGIYKFSSGTYTINGTSDISKTKISYVSQAKQISFSYRVKDYILFGRSVVNSFFASPSVEDNKATQEILELLDIEELKDKQCNELSGGQLQMVVLAKALVSYPDILVLDEPESNLDYFNQLKLLEVLKKVNEKFNMTIIINSHFLNNVAKIADNFLLLKEKDYQFGKYEEIITKDNLAKHFKVEGQFVEIEHNNKKLNHIAFVDYIK